MPTVAAKVDFLDAEHASKGDTLTAKYNIYGYNTDADAHAALVAAAPSTVVAAVSGKTLVSTSYRISAVQDSYWTGEVRYEEAAKKRPEPPETDVTKTSFTISGSSKHVDKSLDTVVVATHDTAAGVDVNDRPKSAPDFKQAIGVTKDGVAGVDILIPEFTFQVTRYVPLSEIDELWLMTMADIVGTVNDATFQGFPAGEILLTSISGSERSLTDAEITYQFSRAKNEVVTVPGLQWWDTVTNPGTPAWSASIPKLGWEHFWIYFEEAKDTVAKKTRKIPKFAYVEQVYEYSDYTDLGLTPPP